MEWNLRQKKTLIYINYSISHSTSSPPVFSVCTPSPKKSRWVEATGRCKLRLASWESVIKNELRFTELITAVLKAELAVVMDDMDQTDPRLQYFTKYTASTAHQIHRQAVFLYHVMYRGSSDRIQVVDSQNQSINGRSGLIIGYNTNEKKFKVRLCTKNVKRATRFTGESVRICPSQLQTVPYRTSSSTRGPKPTMPLQLAAILVSLDDVAGNHVTSIAVDRLVLDTIHASMSSDPANRLSMLDAVRPFISSSKRESELLKLIHNAPKFGAKHGSTRKRRKKNAHSTGTATKPHVTATALAGKHPVHQCHIACNHRVNCNHVTDQCCCPTDDSSNSEPSASPADLFTEKSQFDMSLILKPHDVLFRFPFISENGELISAAHELNELNITPNVQSIRSDEEMFAVCQRFGITITNSDLYHVLPHEIITPSVINLWSQWYVIILGTVSHPIQNRSIRSN